MTAGKNKTLTYDPENRLISVNYGLITESYLYDGDGGRVRKTTDDGRGTRDATTYIGSLYEVDSNGVIRKHIYAGANRVCTVTNDQARQTTDSSYYHSDHLGSSSVITDAGGTQVESYEYTPYGSVASSVVSRPSSLVHHKFTGKELDSSGLYFYGARYYDPEIGRFISADTIVQAPYDPQSLNRYSYCSNNPINYVDPTGHLWFLAPLIIAIVKGAIVGAAIGAASAAIMGGDIGRGALFGAIGGAVFAGFSGLAQTAMRFVTVPGGIGPMTAGATSASNILSSVVGGAASGASVTGLNGGDVGRGALIGGAVAGTFSLIGETASFTRAKMTEQSRLDSRNSSGKSVGYKGDGFKLAGGRYDPDPHAWPSPLGGVQGGQGKMFGFNYAPGSIPDRVFEAYAGPHDFLNGWSYDSAGNLRTLNPAEKFIGTFTNPLNVVLATPIVATSAIPSAVYSAPAIIYGESQGDEIGR